MNALAGMENFLSWLVNHSLQAGALVLFVLLLQRIFRRQLTHRWRFALWWIVLVRLVLPIGPESAVSVFNFFRPAVTLQTPGATAAPRVPAPAEDRAAVSPEKMPRQYERPAPFPEREPAHLAPAVVTPAHPAPARPALSLASGLALLWLAGVVVLSGGVLIQVARFQVRLRRAVALPAAPAAELLEACRREFAVRRQLQLLETDLVSSPALFGLFRLRLLLPRGLAGRFNAGELRYIFLHELAHVKRGDLWLNWLVTALQIMHWFNPLIWFGFARLRADRELACDELTLLRAGEKVGTSYGQTVIKLLEGLGRPAAIPGLVGILEDQSQMRRRIRMIANFRRPGRWSAFAVLLLAAAAVISLTDAQTQKPAASTASPGPADARISPTNSLRTPNVIALTNSNTTVVVTVDEQSSGGLYNWVVDGVNPRPNLIGEVRAKGGGPQPARVFIATAAPKTGTSTLCPSCYADCRKSAKTDTQGEFRIESLDPQLTFQLLVVAKGYKPKFVEKVDPAKGAVTVELEKMERTDAQPDRSVRGRVVDVKGAPIEGAVVEMEGVWRDQGGGWGAIPGVDPLAVSDEHGEFLLTARDPFDGMDMKITARTFADKNFTHVASGEQRHDLVMTEGAMLKGRVLANGKPLKGAQVGVSGTDRSAGDYIGHFEIGTDVNGQFAFLNLPPDADYRIYGIMDTMKQFGAIPIRTIHSAKDGATSDAGDMAIAPAHRLAGKVVLSDGAALPPKTRLLVSREEAWDVTQLTLAADGSFDTAGVPSETISLSARVRGYHLSGQNASLDPMNLQMLGRVDRDITNLVLLLDKGADPPRGSDMAGPETDWPQNRPLRGAEGAADHSRDWTISGRVLDADTKAKIQKFRVTPGQSDQFDHVVWDMIHGSEGASGAYVAHVTKRNPQPILMAEADGYLPHVLFLAGRDATDADFILKRGAGPEGKVLLPDGQPATGASVVLLNDSFNQATLQSKGEFMPMMGNKGSLSTANADGHFSFKPQWGTRFVAAASSNGFAVVAVESLATNPAITLAPYGRVTGTLKRGSAPVAKEELILMFSDSREFSGINLNHRCATDAQGHFAFDRVPAGHLRMYSYGPTAEMHSGGQRSVELKVFELKSGQALELNLDAASVAAANEATSYQPPTIKRIAGAELKGVVLLPNGKPAADAQVALQIREQYLALGRAAFESDQLLQQEGLIVRTDAEGRFTLPQCEDAQFLMALNEEGFAKLSLADFKASPKIALQKWGRIEGSLRVRGHPATNEWIHVGFKNSAEFQIYYQMNAFQARTDDQGRFAFTFLPPGVQTVSRRILMTERSWFTYTLGYVDVKPGETARANFAPNGRVVVGRVDLETNGLDYKYDQPLISTPTSKSHKRYQELKTDEERKAYSESDEAKAAMKNRRFYVASISADGSFRAVDIPPGKYEFEIQPHGPPLSRPGQPPNSFTVFVSRTEFVIPESGNEADSSPVDLGTVELEKISWPMPEMRTSVK